MSLPLFSYPVTIVWIDDDPLFLASVIQLLKNARVISFNSPDESIRFFQQYQPLLQKINFMRGCAEIDGYDTLNRMPVDLNVSALKELYGNDERNEEITVLVVDYNMPNMNGIDLCRELRSLPMKKILLTGTADHQQAVQAFNEGLIDCFIQKDSETLTQDILLHLNRLSKQYFVDRSRNLLSHLETDHSLPLSDPIFITFFEDFCKKHEIQEYYLIDKNGNFLLINKEDKRSYFIVHTDRTLNDFIELHQDDMENGSFIRAVELRKEIPFFGEGVESRQLQPSQWNSCFYLPQILQGRQTYYWAIAN